MAENGYKKLVDVDRAAMLRGQTVFNTAGCMGCHTLFGKGGKIGPDLSEEGLVGHSVHWLTVQFVNSKAHFPDSIMPDFTYLTPQQQHDLAMYISSLGRMNWPDPTKTP